ESPDRISVAFEQRRSPASQRCSPGKRQCEILAALQPANLRCKLRYGDGMEYSDQVSRMEAPIRNRPSEPPCIAALTRRSTSRTRHLRSSSSPVRPHEADALR